MFILYALWLAILIGLSYGLHVMAELPWYAIVVILFGFGAVSLASIRSGQYSWIAKTAFVFFLIVIDLGLSRWIGLDAPLPAAPAGGLHGIQNAQAGLQDIVLAFPWFLVAGIAIFGAMATEWLVTDYKQNAARRGARG